MNGCDAWDHRTPAGRAGAPRDCEEAGPPMPLSHGNSLDSNADTFEGAQHGQSRRRGQGVACDRAEPRPPLTREAETFTWSLILVGDAVCFDLVSLASQVAPLGFDCFGSPLFIT